MTIENLMNCEEYKKSIEIYPVFPEWYTLAYYEHTTPIIESFSHQPDIAEKGFCTWYRHMDLNVQKN